MERMDPKRIPEYQKGAEGFIAFIEENVRFSVPQRNSPVPKWMYPCDLPDDPDPVTGKSFKRMWENQKEEFRKALKMSQGRFIYRLIVFCWPRGEGKSLMVCLLQLWKFFCFPRQLIVFGALSKDQTKFVHYDMIQTVILNSPKLVNIIGKTNIQSKGTYLKNSKQEVTSSFQPISSYSGIVSNITGYTFSEMFDMKDPKFFVQLDGSIRNIVNALGTIDSTVSTKDHVLYRLYKGSVLDRKDRLTYFSYRSAPNAHPDEYWHPHMDKSQLNSYRGKFPPADFDRYFRNMWELEGGRLFDVPAVKSVFYFGVEEKGTVKKDDGVIVKEVNKNIQELEAKITNVESNKDSTGRRKRKRKHKFQRDELIWKMQEEKFELENKLVSMDKYYSLNHRNLPSMCTSEMLTQLGNTYDTDWAILAGLDRSDPLSKNPLARTIITAVAKGLPGSKSSNLPHKKEEVPAYMYVLLHLAWVQDATLEGIKKELRDVYLEFDGIDTFCSERWGAWDLAPWCENFDIKFEAVFPSSTLQKKAFNELYAVVQSGRFKSANIVIPGSKSENILIEEMELFDYNPVGNWYGSPQKHETNGVQDDSMFALGWTIYGGRELGVDDFRNRVGSGYFGSFIPDERNYAEYDL